jgi:Ca-activated chloride channel family protein
MVRLVLLAVLTAAIAGLSTVRTSHAVAVVALIDVSGSARRFFDGGSDAVLERAGEVLERSARGRGAEDLLGVVVFDGRAAAVAAPSEADPSGRTLDLRISDGTNIARAIELGRSLLPARAAGRLLLISDGNQTSGDALVAASRGTGVPIDVVPLRYTLTDEVVVEQLDVPAMAAAEAMVPLRVVMRATRPASGTLRVMSVQTGLAAGEDQRLLQSKRVELSEGRNIERLEVKLDDRRVHRFRAVFEPDVVEDEQGMPVFLGDTIAENNTAEGFTLSPGRGTVLIVDGVTGGERGGASRALVGALREGGSSVVIVAPEGAPADLLSMQEHDVIVLQDVSADQVSDTFVRALEVYVRDFGGGLVMLGGRRSFGAGAWRGSRLEPILPVLLDLPERLVTPEVAIVFVIDNSGSMWRYVMGSDRTQQQIANEATAIAIRSLDRSDLVGVVAFNNRAELVVPLAPNNDPLTTSEKVRGIMSGGGTNIGPALDLAGAQLRRSTAKSKHIVLLTDGISQRSGTLPAQARALREEGFTISTIGVGDDADRDTLRLMADNGGGEYFFALNPNTLPQIFLRAVRIERTPMIREETFDPVTIAGVSGILAGLGDLPPLHGLTLTQPRTDPNVTTALVTEKGEPVLAYWQAGLGQVAAFTSDAHDWARSWLDWQGYGQFWNGLVRVVARPAAAGEGFRASIILEDDRLRVRLEGDAADAESLSAEATVFSPDGTVQTLRLTPAGAGVLEGTISNAGTGSTVAMIRPVRSGVAQRPVVAGLSVQEGAEFMVLASDDELLRAIAARTGGRVLEASEINAGVIFERRGIEPREAVLPLWPRLLPWALLLAVLDIALRRIAWDRWVSARFSGVDAAEMSRLAKARGREAAITLDSLRERGAGARPDDASLALGTEEAQRLTAAARDRRRAQRLRDVSPRPPGSGPVDSKGQEAKPSEDAGGLLAAKRRAAQRFKED